MTDPLLDKLEDILDHIGCHEDFSRQLRELMVEVAIEGGRMAMAYQYVPGSEFVKRFGVEEKP